MNFDCSICEENFIDPSQICLLECGHVFHEACVKAWFSKGSCTCPTCRLRMPEMIKPHLNVVKLSGDERQLKAEIDRLSNSLKTIEAQIQLALELKEKAEIEIQQTNCKKITLTNKYDSLVKQLNYYKTQNKYEEELKIKTTQLKHHQMKVDRLKRFQMEQSENNALTSKQIKLMQTENKNIALKKRLLEKRLIVLNQQNYALTSRIKKQTKFINSRKNPREPKL